MRFLKVVGLAVVLGALGYFVYVYLSTGPDASHGSASVSVSTDGARPSAGSELAAQGDVESLGAAQPGRAGGAFVGPIAQPVAGSGADIIAAFRDLAARGDADASFKVSQVIFACYLANQGLGSGAVDCSGVESPQLSEAVRHVNAAADSGLLAAQLAYPGIAGQQYMTAEAIARDARGFDEYRSTSMRYLREAASSGSVDALITMSSVLSEGLLTDRDPIAAYAYLYAADRTGLIPSTSTSLQLLAEGLSSEDVIRARAAGEQVYAQCCQ